MTNPKRRRSSKSSTNITSRSGRRTAFKYVVGAGGHLRSVSYRLGKLGVDLEDIMERSRNGQPDFALHLLLGSFTLDWMRGHQANVCAQACAHVSDAAALLSLESVITPVRVIVNEPNGKTAVYGTERPRWTGQAFTGHCVLFLPAEQRIIDPTIRQIDGLQHLPYPYIGKVRYTNTDGRFLAPGAKLQAEVQERWIEYHVVEGGDALIRDAEPTRAAVTANPNLPEAVAAQTLAAIRALDIADRLPERHEPIRALLTAIGDAPLQFEGDRGVFAINGSQVTVGQLP